LDAIRDSALVDESVLNSSVRIRDACDENFDARLVRYGQLGPAWMLTDVFVPFAPPKQLPATWRRGCPTYEMLLRRTSAVEVGLTRKTSTPWDVAVAHFARWQTAVIADARAWRGKTGKGATLFEMKHKVSGVTMKQIAQWEALKDAIRAADIGELQDRGVLAARFLESTKASEEALREIIAKHKLTKALSFMEEPETDDEGRPLAKATSKASKKKAAAPEIQEYEEGRFSFSFTDYDTRAVTKAIVNLGHEPSGHFWGALAKHLLKRDALLARALQFDCEAGMFSVSSKKREHLERVVALLREPMTKPAALKKAAVSLEVLD